MKDSMKDSMKDLVQNVLHQNRTLPPKQKIIDAMRCLWYGGVIKQPLETEQCNMVTSIVGYLSSILSTIAFVPQAYLVVKTKNTQSISLHTYAVFVLSVAGWLTYGILLRDLPIIIANTVCLTMGSIILTYKLLDLRKQPHTKK